MIEEHIISTANRPAGLRRWTPILGLLAGAAVVTTLVFGVQPASAATAHNLGTHQVCAQSLTFHNLTGSPMYVLHGKINYEAQKHTFSGDHFKITSLYGGLAYGYATDRDPNQTGYVANGYFC